MGAHLKVHFLELCQMVIYCTDFPIACNVHFIHSLLTFKVLSRVIADNISKSFYYFFRENKTGRWLTWNAKPWFLRKIQSLNVVCCTLTITTLWAYSADKLMTFFLIFPEKQGLTFYANCFHPLKMICMKCQSQFSEKNILNCHLLIFFHLLHLWLVLSGLTLSAGKTKISQ